MEARAHATVMLREAVDAIVLDADGIYVDGTYGRGGHSGEILSRLSASGRLLAFDRDAEAVRCAQVQHGQDARFEIVQAAFSSMPDALRARGFMGLVHGVLLDLGVSSPQLDEPGRGFSFMQDGPLDMRMDPASGMSASDWVNSADVEEMTTVFREYGEERHARRIARAIEQERKLAPINRTLQLAEIVARANPAWEKHKHPATRVFQAIRIHVNNELGELEQVLEKVLSVLKPGGRLAVIAFHSLEDRMVKLFLRAQCQGDVLPRGVPVRGEATGKKMRLVGKAVRASQDEVQANPRARSAMLRIGEKL